MERICFYIDGFNVYHALDDLKDQRLKWLDLRLLCSRLIQKNTEEINRIYYFSALADHVPPARKRHEQYIKALEARNIDIVLGNFKKKDVFAYCEDRVHGKKKVWRTSHEEKESDVNLALYLVRDAYEDAFDTAYVISGDSDIVPAMRMVLERHPNKKIVTIAAPLKRHSQSALALNISKKKINLEQLRKSIFPEHVKNDTGDTVAVRPEKYAQQTYNTDKAT